MTSWHHQRAVFSVLTSAVLLAMWTVGPGPGHVAADGVADFFPSGTNAGWIAPGPDGNLWYTGDDKIGRMTLDGVATLYPIPTASSGPEGITAGPDGNVWFTEQLAGQIGRITTSGEVAEFAIPTTGAVPNQIVAGPDGNLWFTTRCFLGPAGGYMSEIGRISPAGLITEFPVVSWDPTCKSLYGLSVGPDGNFWVGMGGWIGRFPVGGGDLTRGADLEVFRAGAYNLAVGPDGNIWYSDQSANTIGWVTPSGEAGPEFFAGLGAGEGPLGISAGPDGNLWYGDGQAIGAMSPSGSIVGSFLRSEEWRAGGVTVGPDRNIWGAFGGLIARLTLGATLSSVRCSPGLAGSTTRIAPGSSLTCSFAPGTSGTFREWASSGFSPSSSSETQQSFVATTPGSGSIWGYYADGPGSDTVRFDYMIESPPTVTSIIPTTGGPGTAVTITGTNLAGATSATFNGTAGRFTALSDGTVVTSVPSGATSGPIAVVTPNGTATSTTFSVDTRAVAPTVTSFSPTSGFVGTIVTVTGQDLAGATAVKLGTATVTSGWTVLSATQLSIAVPAGAASGKSAVTTDGGTGTSTATFTVAAPPSRVAFVVPTSGSVTTMFGRHNGIDIRSARGSSLVKPGNPVYAMAAGTVVRAGCDSKTGSGWRVVIDHGDVGAGKHLFSLYAHMGGGDGSTGTKNDCTITNADGSPAYGDWFEPGIHEGLRVGRGALLGYQGASGAATGVHLHFEVMSYRASGYTGLRSQFNPTACIGGQNTVGYVYSALATGNACP